MRTFKLTLQYIGTAYCGWQVQPNGTSIQGTLQKVLSKTLREKITVIGAGRTDSGVHALAQVAHFRTTHALPVEILHKALNAQLPDDIAVIGLEEVAEDFHSLFSAKLKNYTYLILQSPKPYPLLTPFVWRRWGEFDWESVEECLELIQGTHDFRSFCASDTSAKTTTREITQAHLQQVSLQNLGNSLLGLLGLSSLISPLGAEASFHPEASAEQLVALSFQGRGFLKHMVRNLMGTLMDVAQGRTSVAEFENILAAKNRRVAGVTAPPQGLFLVKVEY